MSRYWIQYGIYFVFIVLLQGLVINHLGISTYVYPMIYILVLMVLPFDFNILLSFAVASLLGIAVDMLSDTFGLHTSAALWLVYARIPILKLLTPRDGYDQSFLPTIQDMGLPWYSAFAGILIVSHHLWFFVLEVFRMDLAGLVLFKVLLSSFSSFVLLIGLQLLLYKPTK